MHRKSQQFGFTMIELMLVVAIIGLLATIALPRFGNMVRKSHEAASQGNLGAMRSTLLIYYADNEGVIPLDFLAGVMAGGRYLDKIPKIYISPYHDPTNNISSTNLYTAEQWFAGNWYGWIYNYTNDGPSAIFIGCNQEDTKGRIWSSY